MKKHELRKYIHGLVEYMLNPDQTLTQIQRDAMFYEIKFFLSVKYLHGNKIDKSNFSNGSERIAQ